MSNAEKILKTAAPELQRVALDLADNLLLGMQDILSDAPQSIQEQIRDLVHKGAHFQYLSIVSQDSVKSKDYSEAVVTVERRIKTILLAEKIVAEERTANTIVALLDKAFQVFVLVAGSLVKSFASGLAQGAVSGIIDSGKAGGGG